LAVLGRPDEPTDAVEEYCQYLSEALSTHGIHLESFRVRWNQLGWSRALGELREKAAEYEANWYLIQYTALAWSKRGFPLRILGFLRTLKKSGRHCAVVFHDPAPYSGTRMADKIRASVQLYVMRRVVKQASLSVFTIPIEKVWWLLKGRSNAVYIPVGANLPNPETAWDLEHKRKGRTPTVAVYSITGGASGQIEVKQIAAAIRYVCQQMGPVRLTVFGRNPDVPEERLREELSGSQAEVLVHGLLKAEEIVEMLSASDVLLFVRGFLSSRRGSAIAGIACGLPVVAREGWETGPPITDAGVVLVPPTSPDELGPALLRVLQDGGLRASLRERSRHAQSQYFSWDAIASKYVAASRNTE